MARRRMLDPEFFFDEELAQTENSAYVRLFYEGLWCHCDDVHHTVPNKPGWLKAQIFPYEEVDVAKLWAELVRIGKIKEFDSENGNPFGYLKNFGKHQRIEKPSKSKYPAYANTPVVVGEDSGSTPAKVKRSKEKLSKENSGDESPALPVFERKIREKDEEYRALVKDLAAKDYLTTVKLHEIVLDEFLPYWLEKGENGKKARWEKETVFDYQRRLRTWIKNFHRDDWQCADSWHRKGETCHCRPQPDYKNLPISAFARELGANKRL